MSRTRFLDGAAKHCGLCLQIAWLVAGTVCFTEAADHIVLRNLKTISDRTVVDFDADGVRLDNSTILGWDEIEKARVAEARQAEFDGLLSELGSRLYRIRQRLSVGDYREALPYTEAVYARYTDRDSATAYMVVQATMWARLAAGKREASLEAYVWCFDYLRRHGGGAVPLPGKRRLLFDGATGLCPELAPVWFDADAARAALPLVYKSLGRVAMPRPEGLYLYYATMALTAGDLAMADRALGACNSKDPPLRELREIALAQREFVSGKPGQAFQRLDRQVHQISETNRATALYWLGVARIDSKEADIRKQGLLQLLRIPACYGDRQPELAGAALFHSMQALSQADDARGAVSLRKELLEKYGQTSLAARVKPISRPETDKEEKP